MRAIFNVLIAWLVGVGVAAQCVWLTTNSTSGFKLTQDMDRGTNFLTLTNRAHLRMGGVVIVRVTDGEWNLLTNYYRTNLTTGNWEFWGK